MPIKRLVKAIVERVVTNSVADPGLPEIGCLTSDVMLPFGNIGCMSIVSRLLNKHSIYRLGFTKFISWRLASS